MKKTLYDRLTRDFAALGGHSAQGALEKLLPNSMRPVAVKKWGVDPATRAAQITREQKMALVHLCKHWQVPISELGDLQHAVITAGGVDTKEVDPKTMQSKLCPGLYFCGRSAGCGCPHRRLQPANCMGHRTSCGARDRKRYLGQHRTIPALRLKHRSGSCGTASALPKCSIMSGCGTRIVLRGQKPLALCDRCPASVRCFRHWRRSPL